MKKQLLPLLIFLAFAQSLFAQLYTIPDPNFRVALKAKIPNAFNEFEQLNVAHADVKSLTSLSIGEKNIASLDGLQYFTNLTTLYCPGNQLTSLPTLPSKLFSLQCVNNQLTSLPTLPSTLNDISCTNNKLTALPALPASLTTLSAENNQLSALPALPASLVRLYCGGNKLTSLPALPSTLSTLYCGTNQLSTLPDLPASLTVLYCSENRLTSLPTLPAGLTSLTASSNCFSVMPVNPHTSKLTYFSVSPNNPECPEYVDIPDANFRAALKEIIPACFNATDQLNKNCSGVTKRKLLQLNGKNIESLEGIHYFVAIESLDCSNNKLNKFPAEFIKLNNVAELDCQNNQLTELKVLFPTLEILNCANNQLTSLSASLCTNLLYLYCNNNKITDLYLPDKVRQVNCSVNSISGKFSIPASLEKLECVYNGITGFTAMGNMKELSAGFNSLTQLPSLGTSMVSLSVHHNALTSLPELPSTLVDLSCLDNKLTSLPTLPASLKNLECGINQLSNLPSLPAGLTYLSCGVNNLSSLPTLPSKLISLTCNNNLLTSLPALPQSLTKVDGAYNCYTATPVNPYPSTLTKFTVSPNTAKCLTTDLEWQTTKIHSLVYPNPSTEKVTVEANGEEWKLYDVKGSVLMQKWVSGTTEVDVRSLEPGIYFYSLGEKRGKLNKH